MFREHRFAKSVLALTAAGAVALVISGCAFIKPGSLTVSQPEGIGSVRVHFVLCTVGSEICGPNSGETETFQYLMGIAVPSGSAPPATLTAVPVKGGAPIVFTRNDEVATEMAAASAALQKFLSGPKTPKEAEEIAQLKQLFGDLWPPSGLQGVGYLSAPVEEVKGANAEWSLDADFGLPTAADGAPFSGPFGTAIAQGFRVVSGSQPATRPVRCIRVEAGAESNESEAFCGGSVQQAQLGSADLRIAAPAKPAQAFVGGSAELAFPLKFASTAATVPTFALSATTTAKGGKAKLASAKFTPGALNPSTHLAPTGTGKVKVSVPRGIKPGKYDVTLSAKAPQGGIATKVVKLKVTKPKLKFGAVRLNAANGTATLRVKVPGAGRLTITGKGIATVQKKAKKAKTLTVTIRPTGSAARVKVKATFKPTSGISVSKTKSIVLALR
jgi:hypothetical protein